MSYKTRRTVTLVVLFGLVRVYNGLPQESVGSEDIPKCQSFLTKLANLDLGLSHPPPYN